MARVIMIIGDTGAGKSASWRNMPVKKSAIITPNDKKLPWKGSGKEWSKRLIKRVGFIEAVKTMKELAEKGVKYIGIEDYQHFFNQRMYSHQFMLDGQGSGKYTRYESLGRDAASVIIEASALPSDVIVVIMGHTEVLEGRHVLQLFGQMVRNNVKPEGWTEVVLHAVVVGEKQKPEERYVFLTNDDGTHMAKSPMGMFEKSYIPNDLYAAIQAVEAYDKAD